MAKKTAKAAEIQALYIESEAERIFLVAKLKEAENALRNCLLFAMRQSRKQNTGGWESIIRFCKEGGVEPSPLRNNDSA